MEDAGLALDLLFLIVSAVVTFVLYPFWINFVYKFQIGESIREDGPQTHLAKKGTPTMGGMVFVFVTATMTFIFNRSRTQTLFPIFVATLAALFGMIEDFTKVYLKSGLPGFFEVHFGGISRRLSLKFVSSRFSGFFSFLFKPYEMFKEFWRTVGSGSDSGMQSYQKILIEFAMAGFVAYWVYFKLGWDYLWFPLIGNVHLGWLYPVFIFCMFVVVLNFVAVTDGIDGLLGGLALISFLSFWVLSRVMDYNSLSILCATFVGSLIPFLYFNVFPARVFMGNVGSHALAAILAILAIIIHREVAFLFIGLVYLVDGASSPLQQWSVKLTKKRLFRMAPIHHHFELLGWPETKVTLRFWIVGAMSALFGILIALM